MEFDKVIEKSIQGERIDYGFIIGNEKIVFIKTGAGGNIRGYSDKYVKMSHKIHAKYGATVICATNPDEDSSTLDEKAIRSVVRNHNFKNFELYFVGTSDGGDKVLDLASKFPETVKFLGLNASPKTYKDFREKLLAAPKVEKILVYGSRDVDYNLLSPLKEFESENFKFITVDGADHDFTGMVDEFVSLIDLL